MSEQVINKLVDRFLAWPLPASVCSDLCATKQGYPHRSGTTLLSANEAKQMIEYLLGQLTALAPAWSQETPKVEGFYWMKPVHNPVRLVRVTARTIASDYVGACSWAGPIVPPEGTR